MWNRMVSLLFWQATFNAVICAINDFYKAYSLQLQAFLQFKIDTYKLNHRVLKLPRKTWITKLTRTSETWKKCRKKTSIGQSVIYAEKYWARCFWKYVLYWAWKAKQSPKQPIPVQFSWSSLEISLRSLQMNTLTSSWRETPTYDGNITN